MLISMSDLGNSKALSLSYITKEKPNVRLHLIALLERQIGCPRRIDRSKQPP